MFLMCSKQPVGRHSWTRCHFHWQWMMICTVQVDGNLVTWQKWHLRIGFNFKEASAVEQPAVKHGQGCFKAQSADAKAVQ